MGFDFFFSILLGVPLPYTYVYSHIAACIVLLTGNGLAISYPYFHKIDAGTEVKVRGRVSVYCYYSGTPQSPMGWRYSNETKVPPNPLSFELKSKYSEPKKEFVLSTNQYAFSLLNKGRYICDLGSPPNRLDVSLSPTSGTL